MDKETQEIFTKDKLLSEVYGHRGWQEVQNKVIEALIELQDMSTLNVSDVNLLALEVKSRQLAAKKLWEIFTNIEGTAKSFPSTHTVIMQSYIKRD